MTVDPQAHGGPEIENLLAERRTFPPDPDFAAQANATAALYDEAAADYVGFWDRQARERLSWFTPYGETLEWDLPFAKWFTGGELNVAYNCVDRHVERGLGDKVAYHWIGEPGDTRTLTYADLMRESSKAANALLELGVRKGDRVAIYMPMIPELPIAMLACARIGAPHTVVFGGFSAESLGGRINDCGAKVLITADGGWRRGKKVALKHHVDEAVAETPTIEHVIVVDRFGDGVHMVPGATTGGTTSSTASRRVCPPVPVDSEHMLYLLYTSGTTAKPKGILHTTAGLPLGAAFTHWAVFDIKPDDVYWCAADIGWVTGHSYIVYGPLANATTGDPVRGRAGLADLGPLVGDRRAVQGHHPLLRPDRDPRLHEAGRGDPALARPDLAARARARWASRSTPRPGAGTATSSAATGRPVVDTWWQTETGQIMISPLPGVTTTKPGSATFALPGIEADVVDADGRSVPFGGGGYLVLKRPWPGMLRGIYGDPERYRKTYWSRFPGMYFAGDGAKRDEEGYLWLLGRVDDVMNVAGHRISTAEVESALVDHRSVAEAAVVGKSDAISGQAIFAFVILKAGQEPSDTLSIQLREHVAYVIGPIARPKYLMFVPDLPKTRSGKIMRRLLRDIAEGRPLGDVTTLADATVVDTIRDNTGKAEEE